MNNLEFPLISKLYENGSYFKASYFKAKGMNSTSERSDWLKFTFNGPSNLAEEHADIH